MPRRNFFPGLRVERDSGACKSLPRNASILISYQPIDGAEGDDRRREREQFIGCVCDIEDQALAHAGEQRNQDTVRTCTTLR
jgi:hypothetical protein